MHTFWDGFYPFWAAFTHAQNTDYKVYLIVYYFDLSKNHNGNATSHGSYIRINTISFRSLKYSKFINYTGRSCFLVVLYVSMINCHYISVGPCGQEEKKFHTATNKYKWKKNIATPYLFGRRFTGKS